MTSFNKMTEDEKRDVYEKAQYKYIKQIKIRLMYLLSLQIFFLVVLTILVVIQLFAG